MEIWIISTLLLLWIVLLWTFLYNYIFHFSWVYRSRIAGSDDNFMFNCLKNCQTILQSDCTILHPHQQGTSVPFSLHSHQCLLLLTWIFIIINFLILAIWVWFGFAFSWWLMMSSIFHMLIGHLNIFLSWFWLLTMEQTHYRFHIVPYISQKFARIQRPDLHRLI